MLTRKSTGLQLFRTYVLYLYVLVFSPSVHPPDPRNYNTWRYAVFPYGVPSAIPFDPESRPRGRGPGPSLGWDTRPKTGCRRWRTHKRLYRVLPNLPSTGRSDRRFRTFPPVVVAGDPFFSDSPGTRQQSVNAGRERFVLSPTSPRFPRYFGRRRRRRFAVDWWPLSVSIRRRNSRSSVAQRFVGFFFLSDRTYQTKGQSRGWRRGGEGER